MRFPRARCAALVAVAALALGTACAGEAAEDLLLSPPATRPSLTPTPSTPSTSAVTPDALFAAAANGLPAIGLSDAPGNAAALKAQGVANARYQYLSGGVNTGKGWTTWVPDGGFVRSYVAESAAAGMQPVFTYYMLVQSLPTTIPEPQRPLRALADPALVGQYFRDLDQFFAEAHEAGGPVVLHMEPDLWGFAQQSGGDDAAKTPVALEGASSLIGDDLPRNLAGFAQAVLRLRDARAPNVAVAYHMSFWGAGEDPIVTDASASKVLELAGRSATFYRSLNANFDLTFTELGDRDAEFKKAVYRQGNEAWWTAADFERHARYVAAFNVATQQRIVLWQIPYGNTRMRAMNNTRNHYQDNKVEWLLDDPSGDHLKTYVAGGVVAILFGRGADGATDASDANRDGVTNPAPINGNDLTSFSADDDGGFFRNRAAAYYLARAGEPPR